MSKTVWLLDIDGVLNASSRKAPTHLPYNWLTFTQKDIYGKTWPMLIAQEVVDFIDEMSDHVEIVWCSTWQKDANVIGKKVGLQEFRWIDNTSKILAESQLHWKRTAFEALEKSGCKIIWTDDDIRRFYYYPTKTEFKNSLIICPSDYEGLAPRHLNQIRRFIDERA